ncbi:hypothetical protein THAOC_23969 [Thalassiosira oceanica]|uniref:Uncharacterized protein n=1 Tax=Thalassiosira oceanica TaxID=159749 RepID=K0RUX5_THAOC|nr:hypothetical protein THAOC_23969 [Thalassiosira oceanica]|eukprot:EJK56194.1 hypothetical protein THAOC_23969 [Thalassiosira oceanica]
MSAESSCATASFIATAEIADTAKAPKKARPAPAPARRPRRPAGDADQTALSTLSTAGESNGIDDKHIGAPFEEEKGAGSTGAYQSDLKEQGDRESDRTQAIQIAESLLSAKPALCREPCLQGLLRLCRQIGSDYVKYPCTPGVASVPLSAASTPVPELTKDLGRRLYDGEDLRLSDGFALQITHQEEDKVVG